MLRHLLQGLRTPLTEPKPPTDPELAALAATLDQAARRKLGRSLAIREVDAGSCNGCELEIHALNNAFYDLERFGLHFVASPRHADVLLVTGPVTKNMREALERTWRATPDPKWVVAVGDCAADGARVCRQLCSRRRRLRRGAGRCGDPRLPADADPVVARAAVAVQDLDAGAQLGMSDPSCHCEERSDEAIPRVTSRRTLVRQGIASSLRSSP